METLARAANRGSISTGYDIENSVKLEDANNEWFYNASPTAGNRRTYTFSFWIKRTELGLVNASGNQFVIGQGQHGRMYFGGDYFQYRFDDGHDCRNVSRQFRDTSAWYHFVVAVDTNQSSASNRVKLYVNGESLAVDDHDGGSFPDIQDEGAFFSTSYLTLGTAPFGGSYNAGDGAYDMSGYLAEFCAVDGQQLAPTDFGEFDSDSGIWKPIDVSGINFGNQGFYLNFETASDLGDDKSGNGKDLTENNLTAADQATDTPTNNFAAGNNLVRFTNSSSTVVIDGATFMQKTANGYETISGTIYASSGKWYAEVQPIYPTGNNFRIGVMPSDIPLISLGGQVSNFPGIASGDGGVTYGSTGNKYLDGGNSSYGDAYSSGSAVGPVIGIALDMDNGKVYFAKSNVWQNSGDPTSGATGTGAIDLPSPEKSYTFSASIYNNGNSVAINYGGYTYFTISSAASDANGYGTFEYAPPTGYYALCTKNLAEYG